MLSDLKYAIRSLLKAPSFAVIALIPLALGLGATTAIFSVVNTVLLQPLPYAQPERLVRIYSEWPDLQGGLFRYWATPHEYLDLKREAKSWQSLDAWMDGGSGAHLSTGDEPTNVTAAFVTGGALLSLGVKPMLGRLIVPQDDEVGANLVAVISQRLWRRAFNEDPAIVGREILLNGKKHTVVGVTPASFNFPPAEVNDPEIWTPLQIDPANKEQFDLPSVYMLGRLEPNVTLSQARAELDTLVQQWRKAGVGLFALPMRRSMSAYGLHDEVVRHVKPALQMLLGAVGFLLLIACVNVANLLLARAEARQREVAIRGALGAGIWQLARQFFIEGWLLTSAGALVGLVLAQVILQFLRTTGADSIPRAAEVRMDEQVMLFALIVSVSIGLIFGLAPLVHVLKRNLHHAMKAGGSSTTQAAGTQRFRQILIVGQLSLALILLTGAGLMVRAFWNLQQVNAGVNPRGVATMFVPLPSNAYSHEAATDFWARAQARLSALPGIESAALTSDLPPVYGDAGKDWPAQIEGFTPVKGGPQGIVDFHQLVSPGYFAALGIPLVAGRAFDSRDDAQAARVVIVNQSMARMYWGTENPIGHRVKPVYAKDWYSVVGVAADVKNRGMSKSSGTVLFLPFAQAPDVDVYVNWCLKKPFVAIRTRGNPLSSIGAVRQAIKEVDPRAPVVKVRSLYEVLSASDSRPRFLAVLLTLFAGVALVMAGIGIYGVISYAVAQRVKEFGLRMALGAQPQAVLGLVMKRGALLTVGGLGIGIVGAFALTRFLSGFLFGVTATDPLTFVAVTLLLSVIAAIASYIPARRATQVDPLIALRAE